MFNSYFRARERFATAITVAFFASAIAACSGQSPATSTVPATASQLETAGVGRQSQSQFTYQTIDDPNDPTTEILGVNNPGKLVGYYGDGTSSNPDIGILVHPPYQSRNFFKLNYPGGVNTVLTSLNNSKTLAGWYVNSKGQIFGCTKWKNIWSTWMDTKLRHSKTQQTELLGISDANLAVGFYQDTAGTDYPFELDLTIGQFHGINVPGAKSSAATGVSGKGDIVGWLTTASGTTEGWLLQGGHFTFFADPNGTSTVPYAVNWSDDIVGSYTDSVGTHGFILTEPLTSQTFEQIDEPNSSNDTVIRSVNDRHTMVGYYGDGSGNIHGFLATLSGSK